MISSKHILTIGPEFTPPKGGVAQCIATYGQTVFTDFKTLTNSCEGSGITKLRKACSSLLKLYWILASNKEIKIVHIHTASYNSFKRSAWFVNAAKRMGRKVVIHIHGGGFKEYYAEEKTLIDPVLAKCDALITLSPSWKTFFEGTVGHKNVHVVPNIIDNPVIKPVENGGMFHLLYMGHIYKAKGIFDLVEVINECHDEYSGKLVLDIGGGMYEVERLKQFIADKHLEDVIHFHGWVSGDKKLELLNLADAYILPSYTEGVPISILEAESYGMPILSTFVGGIPEIVEDGKNGYLFTPGDKAAIKESIDKILHNEVLRKNMGEASKISSQASLPSFVEASLKHVYSSISK